MLVFIIIAFVILKVENAKQREMTGVNAARMD